MGNTPPSNKTGKKVIEQKLETAKKIGVLSLSEHGLESLPLQLTTDPNLRKLRTLDLSRNKLQSISRLGVLGECMKSLNLDQNNLHAGSVDDIKLLQKLQNLSLARNQIGSFSPNLTNVPMSIEPLPVLPASLKQLNLSANGLLQVPRSVYAVTINLTKLEKLDLSQNQLCAIPIEFKNLKNLQELNLDNNMIVSLHENLGQLTKLKSLSLRNNKLHVSSALTKFSETNPQPLPKPLFTDTLLIDLNLHGNILTNTQMMNQFEGYQVFLDRRQQVKNKTMSNLDVCGLD
jgi:leucine-rich repeat protein SHOC2